ncbi:MAG: TrkH family potassium uptake protein [Bacteroidales bacterium]|nr:TrkH family potassium uptake protein [Bacteroidales bacterium]
MSTNIRLILNILGALLLILGSFMVVPAFLGWIYAEENMAFVFLFSAMFTCLTGAILKMGTRKHNHNVSKKDSYILVTSVWSIFTIFGIIPYYYGYNMSFIDSLFESMSGFTTTGSTVLPNIDGAPRALLMWRSMTQWIGGMGIITLSAVLFPALGIGGMQMFTAEASINKSDRVHPKINEVARYAWGFYIVLTILEMILLRLGGMPTFEAVCHSFSTLSTGGFSPHAASIGFYGSAYIDYVVILFMFLGGMNFTLFYAMLFAKWNKVLADDELKRYLLLIIVCTLSICIPLYFADGSGADAENSFRRAMFHVISVMTSTGFTTDNYCLWPPIATTVTVLLMVTGTCTSSTSGGLKLMRIIITFRHLKGEFRRMIHPTAVVPVKYNNKPLSAGDLRSVTLFLLFYFIVMIVGVILISFDGLPFEDAFGLGANSLGDIGISVGSFGPDGDIASLSTYTKSIMIVLMLLGRLEIFTVVILFIPSFWKR